MIGVSGFVERVRRIAAREPTYRIGGVGKDGTCDCIGLVIGAMTELGHKPYDMHSTNYFARYQVLELKNVTKKDLFVGQILFRTRESTAKLNARYQRGGRYYTGDLLDYYHVAVVTSLNPMEIIECTEYGGVSGIVVNTRFKNWQCGGKLRGVLYDGFEETATEESEEMSMDVLYQARVVTKEDPLTMRATPGGRKIWEIPKGAAVEVLAEGEWAYVEYDGELGYVSSAYLEKIERTYSELTVRTILTDSEGNTWEPVGAFSVRMQLEADGEAID